MFISISKPSWRDTNYDDDEDGADNSERSFRTGNEVLDRELVNGSFLTTKLVDGENAEIFATCAIAT